MTLAKFKQTFCVPDRTPNEDMYLPVLQDQALEGTIPVRFVGHIEWSDGLTHTPQKVHFKVGAIASNIGGGITLAVAIQSVNSSRWADGSTSYGSHTFSSALTADSIVSTANLTTPAALANGTLIQVKFLVSAAPADIDLKFIGSGYPMPIPGVTYGSGTSTRDGLPNVIIEASDGTMGRLVGATFLSATSVLQFYSDGVAGLVDGYNEHGFVVPAHMDGRLSAINLTASIDSLCTAELHVCRLDGSNVPVDVQTQAVTGVQLSVSTYRPTRIELATPRIVAAGDRIAVVLRNTSADPGTNRTQKDLNLFLQDFGSSAYTSALNGGSDVAYIKRQGGVAAFDAVTPYTVDARYFVTGGLILDQIHTTSSGSGGPAHIIGGNL